MASLSRTERLGEAACLRLKDAARRVAEIMREAVVESLRRVKLTAEAVKVLRLLVRRDQVKPRSLSLSPSLSSLSLSPVNVLSVRAYFSSYVVVFFSHRIVSVVCPAGSRPPLRLARQPKTGVTYNRRGGLDPS